MDFKRDSIMVQFGVILVLILAQMVSTELVDSEFTPSVSATCKADFMTIRVTLNQSFTGAVHARDFRSPACMAYGNGTRNVVMNINLFASPGSPDYCGVLFINKTGERSIPIAIRIHKTLELADDKFYVITCGKAGFKNARNETSLVSLRVMEDGKKVQEAVYSHPYTLRAEMSRPDGTYGIRVKSCFAFNKFNITVALIDDRGCPVNPKVISQFKYDEKTGHADAQLFSMFRFPESTEVHFQCDIGICKGVCIETACDSEIQPLAQSRSLANDVYSSPDEGVLMASTSVFVLDPGDAPQIQKLCDDGSVHPSWLLWLCIALGVLFLIMLIINIFLCSAMTCACARTEIIEKEPSIIEDYDPYRSWHGSQYGSRYSLNGAPNPKQGYTSGGSTMNSTRSISSHSDHYAIVHSRPGSRYSGPPKHHRGPPSNIGSHYSGK
ncbi:uncharacterized protein CBL_10188 [Carabus blaptoides fortunei]